MSKPNNTAAEPTQCWRRTTQHLMPAERPSPAPHGYDIYPAFDLGAGKIKIGWEALARQIATARTVILDGYIGVNWDEFRTRLDAQLTSLGVHAQWANIADALLPEPKIEQLVAPFLGGDDPLFGTRFTGALRDFFDPTQLSQLAAAASSSSNAPAPQITYGCGAALAADLTGPHALLIYFDVPKNELQFRSRAGAVHNLGRLTADPSKQQYKRFYFVDWPALNEHKRTLLPRIDIIVDAQRPDTPAFTTGATLRSALTTLARTSFRVRPWFEPGPWGGHWIEQHIEGLAPDVPNYAWSFELIVPENGLLLESDRRFLEVSFDFLMFHDHQAVLGESADRFRYEFPIRFDFLDTFDGGNLSLQCHPRPEYIRRHFGETFTQDETYYILDARPDARVYLGFRDDIDPAEFRRAVDHSFTSAEPLDVERYVHTEPAAKHDLFLIPNGTIHCSGTNNMVLEISATPYIFTFKMYDWMRMDLDGRPRPLNIDRAFENLYFDRRGEAVRRELISRPALLRSGPGWSTFHLPTHPDHFYDVHRHEFSTAVEIETAGSPHVLSLVEGSRVELETPDAPRRTFHYAETFVVPAAASRYRLISPDGVPLKVVSAFIKPTHAR